MCNVCLNKKETVENRYSDLTKAGIAKVKLLDLNLDFFMVKNSHVFSRAVFVYPPEGKALQARL